MHANPVSISLSSYGASLVRERGQESFLEMLAAAGVSCVELREELFDEAPDATALSAAITALQLQCLYSTPLELWTPEGQLDARLPAKLALARALGAVALKVSLGHYPGAGDLAGLQAHLRPGDPLLLVENDQTVQGGRIAPLLQFFQRCEEQGLALGMTFDIGNWQWQGESAAQAAQSLGRWVRYVHCKAVQREASGRLVAVVPQARDLMAWEAMFAEFTPGLMRAVEYPLAGADLLALTRAQVNNLARIAMSEEVSHAYA